MINFDASRNLLQPRRCFFDLDSGQAQSKQLFNRKSSAAVWHRNDDSMDTLLLGGLGQMGGQCLAREFAFEVPSPTNDFYSKSFAAQSIE